MRILWQDIRFAVRILRRSPGFTFVVILILTLSIGANTAIFSIVNAVLLRPLPFRNPDRLVQVLVHVAKDGTTRTKNNLLDFTEICRRNHVFEHVAAICPELFIDAGGDEPSYLLTAVVSPAFFPCLNVQPKLGRGFRREEDDVVILSHSYWKRRYGANPDIVGNKIVLSEGLLADQEQQVYTVVGVMPPDLNFLDYGAALKQFTQGVGQLGVGDIDIWKPLVIIPQELANRNRINAYSASVIARLKPGITPARARAELDLISSQLGREHPRRHERRFIVTPFHERVIANVRPALWVLLCTVGLVLLIACANIANMLLARSLGRRRELAVRAALGAGQWRLVRQFFTEGVLLSLCGGLCALLATVGCFGAMKALLPDNIPRLSGIRIDGWVLFFALLVSIATGALVSLAPVLRVTKIEAGWALKNAGSGVRHTGCGSILHRALLISQVALSLILLIGAGLMIKSMRRLTTTDLGFDPSNVLLVGAPYDRDVIMRPEPYFRALKDKLRELPGIEATAFGRLPFFGSGVVNTFDIVGLEIVTNEESPRADFCSVSEEYFASLRIPMRMGRAFTADDHADAEPVVIVNETIARRYFPNTPAVGQTLTCGSKQRRIVGVVGDVRPNGFRSDAGPTIYFPLGQSDWGGTDLYVIIRTHIAPATLFASVRKQMLAVNPRSPVRQASTLVELLADQVASARFSMRLLSLFGVLALILASAGVYGLMAFFVSQRTKEIGVRIALGAEKIHIVISVLRRGLGLTVIGVALGLACSLALKRVIGSFLYDVSATDPVTFVCVSLLLIGVALLACYIPARRAAKIDPMEALRYE